MLPYTYRKSYFFNVECLWMWSRFKLLFLLLLLVEESGEGVLLAAGAGHIGVLSCGAAVLVPWALLASAALPSFGSVCVYWWSAEGARGRSWAQAAGLGVDLSQAGALLHPKGPLWEDGTVGRAVSSPIRSGEDGPTAQRCGRAMVTLTVVTQRRVRVRVVQVPARARQNRRFIRRKEILCSRFCVWHSAVQNE